MKIPSKKSLGVTSRARSVRYAAAGLVQLMRQEPNARIHLAATVLVVVAGALRHLSPRQWIVLVVAAAMVWITEALNTCIEKLCNLWTQDKWHPEVKIIKDIAAGAVLIAAMASVVIAVVIFFF